MILKPRFRVDFSKRPISRWIEIIPLGRYTYPNALPSISDDSAPESLDSTEDNPQGFQDIVEKQFMACPRE